MSASDLAELLVDEPLPGHSGGEATAGGKAVLEQSKMVRGDHTAT
jgi:hypothetical protein